MVHELSITCDHTKKEVGKVLMAFYFPTIVSSNNPCYLLILLRRLLVGSKIQTMDGPSRPSGETVHHASSVCKARSATRTSQSARVPRVSYGFISRKMTRVLGALDNLSIHPNRYIGVLVLVVRADSGRLGPVRDGRGLGPWLNGLLSFMQMRAYTSTRA